MDNKQMRIDPNQQPKLTQTACAPSIHPIWVTLPPVGASLPTGIYNYSPNYAPHDESKNAPEPEKTGSILRAILPLYSELERKRQEVHQSFIQLNRLLRKDGFTLSWDDAEDRYVIYPLPQALDGTYQMEEEEHVDSPD